MPDPLQIIAFIALGGIAVAVLRFLATQFRLARNARATAALERDYLREQIGLIAEQRRRERETSEATWAGFRKFRVIEKTPEAEGIVSFHLAPHDGKPLPPFQPGQYLTFQFKLPGVDQPLIRCYSLSERPGIPDRYRVTIKRVPGGRISNHLHDHVQVGDSLDVKAPAGHFALDLEKRTPVVLIAGGVGVTPLLAMLNALAAQGGSREVWFFYGVRNGAEQVMKSHLRELASHFLGLRLHVCHSQPTEADRAAGAFQHAERVTLELLKRELPSNQFEFYLCGPAPMMSDLVEGLRNWGVSSDRIFFEAFGPATVRKPALESGSTTRVAVKIQFSRSGRTCAWNADAGSLLDFAQQNGVTIDAGCRAGNCGTCLVAVKSGEVTYLREPGIPVEAGSCLACVAVPKTALTLDA
jgi:uncharacterized protein